MYIAGHRSRRGEERGFTVEYGTVGDEILFKCKRNWKSKGKWPIGDSWLLPDKYKGLQIKGPIHEEDVKYERLLNLLQHNDRRWDTIWLKENSPSSPGFIFVLLTACNRTDSLVIEGEIDDRSFFCLSSGLLSRDGIRRLTLFSPQNVVTQPQMTLLSHGLSRSTSLEFLSIPINREQQAVEALVQGLQANRSLKSLTLNWCDDDHNLLLILPALHGHPTLTGLTLENSYDVPVYPAFQESLRIWLSRADCKLEHICLDEFYQYDVEEGSFALERLDRPNTSLRNLLSGCLNINSLGLSSMLPDLKGLVALDLFYNKIDDLEPLDCLLLGESCRLQSLNLEFNPIEVASARIFAQKLPRMKVLRQLHIGDNPFTEDEQFLREEFADYVYQNKSLEVLRVDTDCKSVVPKIVYGPCLNRAGRRYLGNKKPGILPVQLLPTVLVRAREVHIDRAHPNDPSNRLHGLDASFWLLRENEALFSHLKSQFLQD